MINKAQSTIEFTLAFVLTCLFIVLTCSVFVWMNHCLVMRSRAYEDSSLVATTTDPGQADFYTPPELNVFRVGGYR